MTNTPIRMEFTLHTERAQAGKKHLRPGVASDDHPIGRIPRTARVLALAHQYASMIAQGQAADYADLARRLGITRARMTQIMQLLHLAPDIQEAILTHPPVFTGRDPVPEAAIRQIAREPLWQMQRLTWEAATRHCTAPHPARGIACQPPDC